MSLPKPETTGLSKPETTQAQWVVFTLAGCESAVAIRQVREILRVGEITRMPKAPLFLEGIINLRGKIIPVIDLKKRFQMPPVDRTEESRILIVEIQDQIVGFLVDKVVEVLRFSKTAIEAVQGSILTVGAEFLDGLIPMDRRLIFLLNLKKLLILDDAKALPDPHSPTEARNFGH